MVIFGENHWLLISFLAPIFWALVNIVDVYFVGGIYRDELDGTIISSSFHILPCLLIALLLGAHAGQPVATDFANPIIWRNPAIIWSLMSGIFFTLSYYFYFKALFGKNDVAMLQVVWGLTIIVVPLLSYILGFESLGSLKYMGMAVTLIGVIVMSFSSKIKLQLSRGYLKVMAGAVLFLSLSMVSASRAYIGFDASDLLGRQSFLFGFMCFSFGAFLMGILIALIFKRNPWPFLKKYWKFFIILEGVNFLGNLFSQFAINVSPSVSYVATVETFEPVFILIFSLLLVFIFAYIKRAKFYLVEKIYAEQLVGIWAKIVATVIMAFGVYLLS